MSNLEITWTHKVIGPGIKRLKLPGVTAEADCPICGTRCTTSLDTDAFYYPSLGGIEEIGFVCLDCENDGVQIDDNYDEGGFGVQVYLRLSIEAAD